MASSLLGGRALKPHREVKHVKVREELEPLRSHLCASKKTELNDLPIEVLFDILSRLPVTSLLRAAKYTCKLWNFVINDSVFSELHIARASNNSGHLYNFWGDSNLYYADMPLLNHKTVGMKISGEFGDRLKYQFTGSCRGLISYHSSKDDRILICNPVTGDHVKLPAMKNTNERMWGFGYAPLSKKYKYITVLADKQQKPPLISAIFTFGEKRICRKFDIKPFIKLYFNRWSMPALYHNGALYWTVAHVANGGKSVPHLVSLDLDTEKFRGRRVFPAGNIYEGTDCRRYPAVLGETIAVVICFPEALQEVWVLMDEAKDIWVQKYRYFVLKPGLYGVQFIRLSSVDFTLCGFWQNQEMYGLERTFKLSTAPQKIVHTSSSGHSFYEIYETRCLSYNKETETYTTLHLPFTKDANGDDVLPRFVIPHIGSLVSPSKIFAAAQMAS